MDKIKKEEPKDIILKLPKGVKEGSIQKTVSKNDADTYTARITSLGETKTKNQSALKEESAGQVNLDLWASWQTATGFPGQTEGTAFDAWKTKYKPDPEATTFIQDKLADNTKAQAEYDKAQADSEDSDKALTKANVDKKNAQKAYNKVVKEGDEKAIKAAQAELDKATEAYLSASKDAEADKKGLQDVRNSFNVLRKASQTELADSIKKVEAYESLIVKIDKEILEEETNKAEAISSVTSHAELKTESTEEISSLGYSSIVEAMKSAEAFPTTPEQITNFKDTWSGKLQSAADAKAYSIQYWQGGAQISALIAEAILHGQFSVQYTGTLYNVTLQLLYDYGYEVVNKGNGYLISWKDDVIDKSGS